MECMSPFLVQNEIPVPCGKCPACVKRRVSQWSFRLMQEEKQSDSAHFITLTYDTKTVPITPKGFMSLEKTDVQKFFKRLRKAAPDHKNIKYFAVGEYGGKTNRPHYHAIIFNAPMALFQTTWTHGAIHYGTVSGASVGYTLKYMSKAAYVKKHANDDRKPTFALMSKKMGINYCTEAMTKWHKEDLKERMYCNLLDGRKIAMPRYYKQKIYEEWERDIAGKHALEKMQKIVGDEIAKIGNDQYDHNKEQKKLAEYRKMLIDSKKSDRI